MTTITGLTAERMLEIEANSVVGGSISGNDLILTKHDGSTLDAGNVRGPAGPIGTPPRVTILPATPTDGDEVHYVADATKGVLWHLKYNQGSASPYKWEFVGGSSLSSNISTGASTALSAIGSWVETLTGGAKINITLARMGEYDVEWGFQGKLTNRSSYLNMGMIIGAAGAPPDPLASLESPDPTGAAWSGGTLSASVAQRFTKGSPGNNGILRAMFYTNSGGAGVAVRDVFVNVKPVRIG